MGYMSQMKAVYIGNLQIECMHKDSGAKIVTNAPKEVGGLGQSFSPTDLVALALGTCMLTVLAMAANKLGIDLKGTTLEVEKEMGSTPRKIVKIVVRIRCPHAVNKQIQEKLEKAALECPVYYSLHPDVRKEIDFIWGI